MQSLNVEASVNINGTYSQHIRTQSCKTTHAVESGGSAFQMCYEFWRTGLCIMHLETSHNYELVRLDF